MTSELLPEAEPPGMQPNSLARWPLLVIQFGQCAVQNDPKLAYSGSAGSLVTGLIPWRSMIDGPVSLAFTLLHQLCIWSYSR